MEFPMLIQLNKLHPALKHAGYSATTLLPGEDLAAFEKLHRALIHEFAPVGTLEEEIVADMARLTWRKQNLATFRIAQLAQKRHHEINAEKVPTFPARPARAMKHFCKELNTNIGPSSQRNMSPRGGLY